MPRVYGITVQQDRPHYTAIIVAAGSGQRSGQDIPKQYVEVGGKALVRWSAEFFASDPLCDQVIISIGPDQAGMAAAALQDVGKIRMIEGGTTRRLSVKNSLETLAEKESEPEFVLIHDAARPFVAKPVVERLLDGLAYAQGAVPVLAVADTIVEAEGDLAGSVMPREQMRRVQTPQAFHYSTIMAAHALWTGDEASDDAQMLRAKGGNVIMVDGSTALNKITFPDEFAMAENMLNRPKRMAIGMGYDVHRLVVGKELWLGGIRIEHSHGLSGHSDADAALHALTDAVLGALAEGDIGQHFPPSDPQWKGASSDKFLEFAGQRVLARQGEIHALDLTIICEAPKIGPHREAMRARISEILQLPLERISVKATTTEGIGFSGRREGIAAQAIASIALPFSATPFSD